MQWLLDIGSDFHRRCYGNFFTCDDQKGSRRDNKNYEEPDLCLVTNYAGYVAWGEYPFAFAACLEQEECYRSDRAPPLEDTDLISVSVG